MDKKQGVAKRRILLQTKTVTALTLHRSIQDVVRQIRLKRTRVKNPNKVAELVLKLGERYQKIFQVLVNNQVILSRKIEKSYFELERQIKNHGIVISDEPIEPCEPPQIVEDQLIKQIRLLIKEQQNHIRNLDSLASKQVQLDSQKLYDLMIQQINDVHQSTRTRSCFISRHHGSKKYIGGYWTKDEVLIEPGWPAFQYTFHTPR